MSNICKSCGQAKTKMKLPERNFDLAGIPLKLINAVTVHSCICGEDAESIDVPNIQGLKAAAAITRVYHPQKLCGMEIKFLRKSMNYSAKELGNFLEATPETISRWENDKIPVGAASEKLLRMLVVAYLKDHAPMLDYDIKDLGHLKIVGFAQPGRPIGMTFEFVRCKPSKDKPVEGEYVTDKAA